MEAVGGLAMLNIACVMVLKSENGIDAYYIDMALLSLLPHVNAIYVQDQGCRDETIEIVKETVGNRIPLIIEKEFSTHKRFDETYNEPLYRNRSIERCEELFNPDWMIQCDADDIFTPFLFEKVGEFEKLGKLEGYNGIFYSSDRFITPEFKTNYRGDLVEYGGRWWVDPHYKFWRTNFKVRYPAREAGHFHNVPARDPAPLLCIEGVCNIHLHRMFGPKAFAFWRQGGDVFEETKPFNPRRQAPKWFNAVQNMGSAVRVEYAWPDHIMNKWKEWGNYD